MVLLRTLFFVPLTPPKNDVGLVVPWYVKVKARGGGVVVHGTPTACMGFIYPESLVSLYWLLYMPLCSITPARLCPFTYLRQ